MSIKFIDLFAGTGAFTYAFEKNGNFCCVFANDILQCQQEIYNLNFPKSPFVLEDINKLNVHKIPQHELLIAGFPCQPFSIAGKQKGFKDTRQNVFWKIIDILKKHKPSFVMLENVKNLKTHDNGKTYKTIKESLKNCGYFVKQCILDTRRITDIPQHRERIYIMCFRDKDMYNKFTFDFQKVKNKKIKDFLEENVDKKYYYTNRYKVFQSINDEVVKTINDNVLYQYRRFYVRENKTNSCPTLTQNMGSGGHNVPLLRNDVGIRKLTPKECFNLQGFPKNYKLPKIADSLLYKMAGNAVSIPVIELLVKKLSSLMQF